MFNFEEGELLLLDKPLEWTSFDVVKKIRNTIRVRKVGHAGTLDPLATGLLITCTGKMTKKINEFQALPKEYAGVFVLGQSTPSHDLETEVSDKKEIRHITEKDINGVIEKFKGSILQVPPAHSAIKKDGQRAYLKARAGQQVDLEPREVEVYSLEVTNVRLPEVYFHLKCSKGFYVRSLARDFGETLGTGAYLSELRRTRIGNYSVDDAWKIEDFVNSFKEWKSTKG
ncbi:tRNA pseudouridine(55) synthase TruB [Bacteroidota bacterium]